MPRVKITCDSIFDGENTVKKGEVANVDVDQAKRLILRNNGILLDGDKELTFDEAVTKLRMTPDDVAQKATYDTI